MGLYATPPPLAGGQWTAVGPGEPYTLLNGTETIVSGSRSFAFSLGYSPTGSTTKTFEISGCAAGSTVQIQAATPPDSRAEQASDYTLIATPTLDANGNGEYTDLGASAYYTAVVNSFVMGDKPVVTVRVG